MKQIDGTQKVGIINVQFIDIIKSQNKLLKNNKKLLLNQKIKIVIKAD